MDMSPAKLLPPTSGVRLATPQYESDAPYLAGRTSTGLW